MLQRAGNLSQTLDATGNPFQIYNPNTGMPYAGNIVPVSPQAQALLNQYPLPNLPDGGVYNYQTPVISSSQQNNVQFRASKSEGRNQFFGNLAYAGTRTKATDIFGFKDSTTTAGLDAVANWSRNFRPVGTTYLIIHFQYEFSRLATNVTPYFANRANISGAAGILGNDQDPVNWGPPNLAFSSGLAGFSGT